MNIADLIITSPPYDNLRNYGGHKFDFVSVANGIYYSLKDGGVLVWVVNDQVVRASETGSAFRQVLYFMDGCGLTLHDTMIFEKNTSSFPAKKSSNRYTQIFEYMFVLSKGKPKTATLICDKENKWAGWTNWGKQTKRTICGKLKEVKDINPVPKLSPRNNIWKYTVSGGFGQKDKTAYKHPATFPEKLVEDHILTWSSKGDLILDPMCGSGTTCVVAKKTGRNYLGIEIHKEYFNLAKKRCR